MKCGIIEDDMESIDSRMNEIKNRCKEKRKTYDGEDYAFIHCTGYVPVRIKKFYKLVLWLTFFCRFEEY